MIESFKCKIDKLKVHPFPDPYKFKIFAEIPNREEAVKVFDIFFKGKFDGVKSSVYILIDESILKNFTINEI